MIRANPQVSNPSLIFPDSSSAYRQDKHLITLRFPGYTKEILESINMISAEVSLYPVETADSDQRSRSPSTRAINISSDIGSLAPSPRESDQVWSALRRLHERAQALGHEVVMVVTISNG